MALVRVIQGQTVEAAVAFRNAAGETIVGNGDPVAWTVRDWNNNLIVSGAGNQDSSEPELWTARFAIPEAAPVSQAGERYQILWELPLTSGSISAIERFEVQASGDPIQESQSSDILVYEGKPLIDSLVVPTRIVADSLKYQVIDLGNNALIEEISLGDEPDREINDNVYYDFTSNQEQTVALTGRSTDLIPLMGVWEYQLPGETTSYEFHGIYIFNLRSVAFIQKIRGVVDRANLKDIHPFLTFTDLDLIHYLIRGFEYLNSIPPSLTNWSIQSYPATAQDIIVQAGAMRALQGQYLAEGMATFDFQGLGVQLSTDRTQYIQTMVDNIQQDLQERVPRYKRLLVRSSSPGVLSVSVSPITSFVQDVNIDFYQRGELYRAFPFVVLGY